MSGHPLVCRPGREGGGQLVAAWRLRLGTWDGASFVPIMTTITIGMVTVTVTVTNKVPRCLPRVTLTVRGSMLCLARKEEQRLFQEIALLDRLNAELNP